MNIKNTPEYKGAIDALRRLTAMCDSQEAELTRLRAVNAELVKALRSLRPIVEAIHTALATMPTDPELQCLYDEADGLVEAIDAAISRAEQAKPETCVWTVCPGCGRRIEVKN